MNNRRITWKRILAVASVSLLFAGVGAIWFLHSSPFREWALRRAIQIAEDRSGTKITVQALELSLYPFVANLQGVTVRGTEPTTQKPLFHADNVRISLGLVPLLRKDAQLELLILEKPEIAIRIDSRGQSNLNVASPPSASSSGALSVGIRYAAVHDGFISYGDKTVPLAAEIYGLQAELAATPGKDRYHGRVQYESGRVEAKDLRAIEHSLSATFRFDEELCTVEQWQVKTRNSEIHGHAQIANYQHPRVTAQYDANVQGEDVRFIFNNTQVPAGTVQLQGNVRYTSTPDHSSFLERMDVEGQFQSGALRVPQYAISVEQLRGKFTLQKGLLRIANIEGQTLGGVLGSDGLIDLVNNSGSVQARLRGAQLWQLKNPLQKGEARSRLASIGTVDFAAHWKSGFVDPEYHLKSTFQSPTSRSLGPQDIPAEGTVDVTYESAHSRLMIADSHLKVGATQLRLSGEMSKRSALTVDLQTEDLQGLVLLVSNIQPSQATQDPTVRNLRGAAEFSGRVTGALSAPQIAGRLTGRQLVLGETQWSSLQTSLVLDPNTLELENLLLTGAHGQIRASMHLPLSGWTLRRTAPLSVQAQLQNVLLATLQKTANISYPVEGLLSGEARMTGSVDQPVGSGHIDLTRAVVYNEPLTELHADFSAKGKSIALHGTARGPAGALTGLLSYDLQSQEYDLQGKTDKLDLAQINTLHAKTQDINGQISASISGKGTLNDPHMSAQIASANLNIRGEDFKQSSLRLTAGGHRADLELKSRAEGADLSVKGHVELTSSYASDVMIDTGAVSIAPILQRYLPSKASGASGQLEIHAHLSGPLKQLDQLQGRAEVTNIHLVLAKNVELSNPRPMRLEYRAGALEIKDAALKGNATDLNASGSIPVRASGELSAKAQGTLDLKALENFVAGGSASGQVKVQLQTHGTWQAPQINGTIELANAAYTSDSTPLGLESMNGTISVHGRRVEIEHLSGLAGGGQLTIGGGADIGAAPAYAFTLTAQSARVRQNGVRAQVDANLTLHGGKDKSTLAGQVMVRRLTFNQGSDLAEIVASFSGDDTLEEPSPFLEKINLDVFVRSDEQLALASDQLSVAGTANLNVAGNLARPILLGRISLTSGEIFFLGKRLEIQNGTVVFANAARTNPVLNLSLNTTVEQYKITINLTGALDKLRTTYSSDPSLPSADIINLLAFGQTTTETASNTSAPATLAAESAVANAVGNQVAGQLQKVTGISQLTIDPMAGNSQSSVPHVAIQQRVSGNLLVTFSTDITNAQSQAVQLKYQWKPNITVSILRDENGGYGLDVHYHKTF